ncbi:MAG TPA: ArgE/DapE family deacylase [Microlunatus sp.]
MAVSPTDTDWRERLLGYLDEHRADIVTDLVDLVRIPSISGSDEENEIQHVLAHRLAELGLEVDSWEIPLAETLAAEDFPGVEVERREGWGTVGRLSGRGDGNGRSLMLNAHVDVVPPGDLGTWGEAGPFGAAIRGGDVHGRGTCDMKAGLVASLWVLRACTALGIPLSGDLLLGTVIGEEDGGLGTYALLQRGWRADACVIPEPTSLDLAPATSGALTFRLAVTGQAAHASRRLSGVSAIEKFLPVFAALRRLEASRNELKHPLMTRWELPLPIELGMIRSGEWASSVPDVLTAEGRLGVAIGEDPGAARRALAEAVDEVCAADPWLRAHPVSVEWWGGQFAPGLTDVDADILDVVRRAHGVVSERPQDTWGTPYGSDLRLMTNLGGIPTVHYGPGDAALAHGPYESVPVTELFTATRALALVTMEHCGVRDGNRSRFAAAESRGDESDD